MIRREQAAYDELNKKLKYKSCDITLNNNKVYKGRDINIGIDTSSWVESYARGTYVTAKERRLATSKVKYISLPDYSFGMIPGLFAGILVGAGVGYMISSNKSRSSSAGSFNIDLSPVLFPVSGALIGGMIGIGIGSLYDRVDSFILLAPTDSISNSVKNQEIQK
jgi:hypothetical protein